MAEVSITDIARAAGVSPSTVSRALANNPRISAQRSAEIQALVQRTGQLALELQACVLPQVLCHSDLHPGNLLIHSQPGNGPGFHIVDWDQPVLAPRERDLMGIGGGLGARWSSPREVELFYQGYGQPLDNIDRAALTYYRCERILMDITEFCKQLLLSDAGGADRPQALEYFTSSFLPGHEIEAARKGDPFPCSVKNEW
jgi:spectinomycin phosphotransferase